MLEKESAAHRWRIRSQIASTLQAIGSTISNLSNIRNNIVTDQDLHDEITHWFFLYKFAQCPVPVKLQDMLTSVEQFTKNQIDEIKKMCFLKKEINEQLRHLNIQNNKVRQIIKALPRQGTGPRIGSNSPRHC